MSRLRMIYDDKKLRRNTASFKKRLRHAIAATVDRQAAVSVGWMKVNAPWTDRTGAARSGLWAIRNGGATFEEILMGYSVYYGIWLEVANDRQYAIVNPAMRVMGAELLQNLENVIDRMPRT